MKAPLLTKNNRYLMVRKARYAKWLVESAKVQIEKFVHKEPKYSMVLFASQKMEKSVFDPKRETIQLSLLLSIKGYVAAPRVFGAAQVIEKR